MDFSASWIQQLPAAATDISIRGGVLLRGRPIADKRPVHLIFLIDTSGSMAGERLESVKRSLEFALKLLTSRDMVSIITFDDEAKTLVARQRTTPEAKPALEYKIQQIRDAGSTNMSAALMQARQVVGADLELGEGGAAAQTLKEGIILLTDGHANRGVMAVDGLGTIATTLLQERPGLTIATVGYGADHNTNLLTNLATAGGGSYNIVQSIEDVAKVFGDIMGGLSTVVAQNVTVILPPDVKPLTVYTTKKTADGTTEVNVGDLYAETEAVVLFEASPAAVDRVRVVGDDMMTLAHEDQTVEVAAMEGEPNRSLEIAYYRYQVAQILKSVAALPTAAEANAIKGRAESLVETLKALAYASEGIIQMMIDDLERCLITLDAATARARRPDEHIYLAATTTAGYAQHAAMTGLGRGLRSLMPEDAEEDPDTHAPVLPRPAGLTAATGAVGDPQMLAAAAGLSATPSARQRTARVDATLTPFSNRLMATTSLAMGEMSQAARVDAVHSV
jgi:Mg-chelatase subunit ChlD